MYMRKSKANRSVKGMSYPVFGNALPFFNKVLQVVAFGNYFAKIYECMEIKVGFVQQPTDDNECSRFTNYDGVSPQSKEAPEMDPRETSNRTVAVQ